MIRVGKIAATHGLKGAVVLVHILEQHDWLSENDVLFLELRKGSQIPYFITEAKEGGGKEYMLLLDEVETQEDAAKLVGKNVYVKEELLEAKKEDSPLAWIGFSLVDKTKGGLGTIEDVMQVGSQWLAQLTIEGKEVLIPLADEMIVDLNLRNKFIRMDLPEGLIEVYLGNQS